MLYQFKCRSCEHEQEEWFNASDYDKRVTEDGKLKRKRCKECKSISLYRHITGVPGVLGGTKGYVSMERWQQQNPDYAKRKEEQLTRRLEARRQKKLARINKQTAGNKREERHKNYGEGKRETKLDSPD